jgi:Fe-S-cluster containining protein
MRVDVNKKSSNSGVDQLCPNCGLCCNGVLFADVELRQGDDPGRLAELGLALGMKGSKLAFAQPCTCFDGKLCSIYADRPKRCRTFECGLLKRVQVGELDADAALKTIAKTKRQVENVRGLLRQLGQNDERLAMTKRYAEAMSAPIDLAGDGSQAELRGELMLAVDGLMRQLQREFLK